MLNGIYGTKAKVRRGDSRSIETLEICPTSGYIIGSFFERVHTMEYKIYSLRSDWEVFGQPQPNDSRLQLLKSQTETESYSLNEKENLTAISIYY